MGTPLQKSVLLYARVSTGRQAEKDLSIPDQLAQMRTYCDAHGYKILAEYVEPGRTATNDKRPEFQSMIHRVLEGTEAVYAVLVHSLSRAFRNVEDMVIYVRKLRSRRTRLISITQDLDDSPTGRVMSLFYGLVDEINSAENSKHVKRARRENARRGCHNGSKPPYGYKATDTKIIGHTGYRKVLVLNEDEAAIVREIFDLYEGVNEPPIGMKKIAGRLNEKCLYRGQRWRTQIVQRILSDAVYTGQYIFGDRTRKAKGNASGESNDI